MKTLPLLLLTAGLASCASPPVAINTPSGKPEITIQNAQKKLVLDRLVEGVLSNGKMQLKSATDYATIFTAPMEDFGSRLVYGSRYDSKPEMRISFNAVQTGAAVRVFARADIATNPNSAFEKSQDVTADAAQALQQQLESFRSRYFPQ